MIDHPFIVKFLEEFMIDGKQCIIMELAEKGSLKSLIDKRIQEKKPFSDKEVWRMAANLSLAILYVHHKNVHHRDLKP